MNHIEPDPKDHWVLRKEINLGTVITLVGAIIAGVFAFASVKAEVANKATSTELAVVEQRQKEFRRDIDEIKSDLKEILRALKN